MPSFDETIARMKGLYTYGKEINESNDLKTHTLEYHAIAADGKSYGIIRECNKYYIKTAPKDKEMVAEAYDYIGGFCNKGNYEYKSYSNALKNFEMKMSSINEACEGEVNISTLDPFKKGDCIVEGTKKMQNEIARCRQIMYNAAMIMNESFEKSNPVVGGKSNEMTQPEAPKSGKVDEITKGEEATPDPTFEGTNKGKMGGKGPKEDAVPYGTKAKVSEGKCSECGCPNGQCTCKNCNEEAGDIGDAPLKPNTENWGTEGIGKGRDPKTIGWEMDGQKRVNEEENDWASKGLPSSPGVGDADTDHNNDPFNKGIMNEEGGDFDDEDPSTDTDFDAGLDDEFSGEDDKNFGDEGDAEFDSEVGGDDEFDDEEGNEFDDEEGFDEFGDEEGNEFGDEEGFDEFDDEEGNEFDDEEGFDEFGDEEGNEFDDEEGFDEFDDEEGNEFDDEEGNEFDDAEGNEFDDEEGFDEFDDEEGNEFDDEEGFDEFDDEEGNEFDDEEGDEPEELNEAKLNRIINSVVNKAIRESRTKNRRRINEDELHVFGKHPGYRKKPMELPTTGQDKNQWGEDWNDESVHSEEPFGSKIGNGDPFNKLVNAITKDVMYQLKKGIPIEGMNKKKAE